MSGWRFMCMNKEVIARVTVILNPGASSGRLTDPGFQQRVAKDIGCCIEPGRLPAKTDPHVLRRAEAVAWGDKHAGVGKRRTELPAVAAVDKPGVGRRSPPRA